MESANVYLVDTNSYRIYLNATKSIYSKENELIVTDFYELINESICVNSIFNRFLDNVLVDCCDSEAKSSEF